MERNVKREAVALLVGVMLLTLTGCGGASSSSPPSSPPPSATTYTVSGMVSGLSTNESVTLLNNGGGAVNVIADGGFVFSNALPSGGAYDVTVKSHTPAISCAVSNGSGTVGSANVTSIDVACAGGTESVLYSFGTLTGDEFFYGRSGDLIMDGAGNLYGITGGGGADDDGTVFEISPNGTETTLHSFAGGTADGALPYGQLIMDGAGSLYGTTSLGGPNNGGTVFKISPNGTETILYSFGGTASDGTNPVAGLVMDSAGNLYGTTPIGGEYTEGTVFKVSANGEETVLHSFGRGTDGMSPESGLIMDNSGNLYGTTWSDGQTGAGTVFEISPVGVETILHNFAGGLTDGEGPFARLIMDSTGSLYGTTSGGGPCDCGTVFKITPTGTESVLYAFTGGATDGWHPDGRLLMDSSGNLYGTTLEGGPMNEGTAFKISPTGTETVLYFFVAGPLLDGSEMTQDESGPAAGMITDGAGNLYGTTDGGGVNGHGMVFEIN